MVSSYCGVYGCINNAKTTPHLSFFSLPKDDKRRNKWIELMDRNDIMKKKNTRYLVCSAHFTKDMFKNKRLKPDAVPSLNLPGSNVILCRSSSLENLETQVDKPVIVEMVQVKLPTTMESSTQVQIVSQEKQTQTHENISTKQCQCYSQIQTNSYIVASTETKTEGHNPSEEENLIHVEKTPLSFLSVSVQTSPSKNYHRDTVQASTTSFTLCKNKSKTSKGAQTAKILTEDTPRERKLKEKLCESEKYAKKLKRDLSAMNRKPIIGVKRKLSCCIQDIELKRKKIEDSKNFQSNSQATDTSTSATERNSDIEDIVIKSEHIEESDNLQSNLKPTGTATSENELSRESCNVSKQTGSDKSNKRKEKQNKKIFPASNFIDKFYEWQKKLKAKYKGNRYKKELKLFAMNVYFNSPQTYRLLEKIFALPSVRTLRKLKMIFKPGVSKDLLKLLSTRLTKLSSNHKYCVLCLDEMVLKKKIFYDILNDEVIGFHNIDGNKREEIASNAFVIMLRGCVENYKQPLGYALTATTKNYSDLGKWLDKTIRQLFDAGFVVCAVVSDQGSNFLKLASLKGATKDSPYFVIDGKKVFYLFDVPYLFKSIRNNLIKYNFQYNGNKLACWSHLESFYSRDKQRDIRMAPKLTDAHLNPNRLQRMKVRYATQALSHTVAAGLSTDIELGHLPPRAKETVELISQLNNTFDVLNSSKVSDANKYKRAFHGADYQQECLKVTLNILKSIKAINITTGKDNTNMIKAFSGLIMTINGILQLYESFKSEGLKFCFTRRFNQDPLENFFGVVRQQGGNTIVPTPIQFQRAFSKLVLEFLLKKSSLSDCEEDLDLFLLTKSEDAKPIFVDHMTSETSPLAVQTSDYRLDLPSHNAFSYVCGYLFKKCSLKHECSAFKEYKNCKESNADNSQLFIFGSLTVPPASFVNTIEKFENEFTKKFKKLVFSNGAGANLLNTMKKINFEAPCECFPSDYLIKLYIRMRIYYSLKFSNRNLKAKSVEMPSFLNVRHL